MPLHDDEAIVVRGYDLAETDRIVVLFARKFGKIRGVAKGAKRIKSSFMGSLDSSTYVRVNFYEKEGVDLVKIKRCEIIEHFLKHPDLSRSIYIMYLTELLEEFSTESNANEDLFRLALVSFRSLQSGMCMDLIARYFELWLLKLEGIWPHDRYCNVCHASIESNSGHFDQGAGVFTCNNCKPDNSLTLDRVDFGLMREITDKGPSTLDSSFCSSSSLAKLEQINQTLIQRHVEREIKSYRIVKELVPAC